MKLLLISNSIAYGKGYLDHCEKDILVTLGKINTILFIPYALQDHTKYAETARERFAKMGIKLTSIHTAKNPKDAVKKADSIFVGGGNTFRLLSELQKRGLLPLIKKRVLSGTPYLAASAGVNVACPTIKTTNDMPIVEPKSFQALDLVPFQINAHYFDPDPKSKHMGETRQQRIKEFHEENTTPVVGLREGTWLLVDNNNVTLKGEGSAKLFQKGKEPREIKTGETLDL
ncbi:dipeptidase PepE [Candidatus Roizmanbacteria bacterium]|nr:dipeptidase PepE [Candidatus Roizmanbacteria bacterium]